MNKFIKGMEREENFTKTENEAIAYKSTGKDLLDLFGQIGALRSRSINEVESLFSKAFSEDKLIATKMAFYCRDIRGGLGERKIFRIIIKFLSSIYPDVIKQNLDLIPKYGRWDDLFVLIGTKIQNNVLDLIQKQFNEDLKNMTNNEPISLLAKWLKTPNTKNVENRKIGLIICNYLNLSEKSYRKLVSKMRKYLNDSVVETKMSSKKWEDINYSNVCSNAMNKYRKAFYRNDEKRFDGFINKVKSGEEKINASTLYPYDLVGKYINSWGMNNYDEVVEQQWKSLPNYIEGENNVIVMADVSGSMACCNGQPLATSIGLATYFAERNKGVYADKFMTFSHKPQWVNLKGNTLYEKIMNAVKADWQMNTNIAKAMYLILETAIKYDIPKEDMPKSLIIVSDMQFDSCSEYDESLFESIEKEYNNFGVELPYIVFWNVNSKRDTFQKVNKMQLVSGQSVSTFKTIIENLGKSPYEAMINTLEKYNDVKI
jgi:hypothetical protein